MRDLGSESEFFIENLQVRIHYTILMIIWTGLAPWEFELPVPGSLSATLLDLGPTGRAARPSRPAPLVRGLMFGIESLGGLGLRAEGVWG